MRTAVLKKLTQFYLKKCKNKWRFINNKGEDESNEDLSIKILKHIQDYI